MKLRLVSIFFSALAMLTILHSCKIDPPIDEDNLVINLRVMNDYSTQTNDNISKGILWSLSYLGAQMASGSLNKTISIQAPGTISLNLSFAGFTPDAQYYLRDIIKEIKATEEYKLYGAVDIGRFFMLTLYSPYHYYAITNAPRTYQQFQSTYQSGNLLLFPVNNSSLVPRNRLINFVPATEVNKMGFTAFDGHGDISLNTFEKETIETWAIMPNGQMRYTVYDANGNIQDASSTEAGKPGKCMWCHEIKVIPLFNPQTPVAGYLPPMQYMAYIDSSQQLLDDYRSTLTGEIDYHLTQDHTYSELLYVAFMEPNIHRIAQEWNIPEDLVIQKVSNLPTHISNEYPSFGTLYNRKDIDALAPYASAKVPESVRQQSNYEPDIFHLKP